MAKTQGLNLKDLLDKQRELAAEGNEAAQKQVARLEALADSVREQVTTSEQQSKTLQSVEKLAKQDRVMQAAQVIESSKILKDENLLVTAIQKLEKETKKGLLDKNGDGLNANILKLSKDIRAALGGGRVGTAQPGPVKDQLQEQASKSIASSTYYRGSGFGEMFGKIRSGINAVKSGVSAARGKGIGQIAREGVSSIRNKVSSLTENVLENTFDLSEGKSEGLAGRIVKKRVAKNQFIRDEMKLNPSKNPEMQRKMLGLRFEKNNEMIGKMQETQGEIERLRSGGATEEQIKKTGLLEQRAAIEQTAMITDPKYREQARRAKEATANAKPTNKNYVKPVTSVPKNVEKPAVPVSTTAPAIQKYTKPAKTYPLLDKLMDRAGANSSKSLIGNPLKQAEPDAAKTTVAQSIAGLIGPKPESSPLSGSSSEAEQENLRLFTEQNETLKKIEENTRLGTAGKVQPVTGQPAAAAEGGGILSSVADFAKDKLLGKAGGAIASAGGKYLGSVGGAAKLAKGVGIGGIASLAGEGIQAGGDALKEAGYEQTGKAVNVAGTATKYAGYGAMIGSVIPGVGTAIGAGVGGVIGAGKGIYDQYFGSDSKKATPVSKGSTVNPPSGVTSKSSKLRAEAEKLGIDPNKAEGKFEAGQLTQITDTETGKTYPIAVDPSKQRSVDAVREMRASNDRSAQLAKNAAAPTPQGADEVYQQSGENASAANKASAAPVIVNAPSNTTVSQTTNNTQKSPPRNTESSYRAYDRAKYAF